MENHKMTAGGLTATVKAQGAELCGLQDAAGNDFIWPASPPWQRHAPILFPIVGRLKDDTLLHEGKSYRMTQHGFARDRDFAWVERGPASCHLTLTDDDDSRAIYPFAFRLDVRYALDETGLTITFVVANPADVTLHASVGAHPAFRWPLREGVPKEAHRLVFETEEPDPVRGVIGGLLTPPNAPLPMQGRVLPLTVDMFAADALILDPPRSTTVTFEAPGGPAIRVSWEGCPQLGLWSRPDADLLCIEPWRGTGSPPDFNGDFADKPNLAHIPPGGEIRASHRIEVMDAASL